MKLDKNAFANSIAVLIALFYVVLYLLGLIAPPLFDLIYNAQFFGADVASLFPAEVSLGNFAGTLVILVITGWVGGYVWVWFYNRFTK